MKLITKATLTTLVALTVSQSAYAGLSANVGMTTDYRYRGISQNDKAIAIQGGFDYEDDGFYVGIWGSSVDFQVQTLDDATAEVDVYAGFTGSIGDSEIDYSVGFLHYSYPNSDSSLNYNFTEITASLSYDIFALNYGHTSDYFAGSGSADYINVSADFALSEAISLGVAIGHQTVDDNAAWGTPDWTDYKIGLSGTVAELDLEVAYIGTDLDQAECFGGSDWCDGTIVLTVSKSM